MPRFTAVLRLYVLVLGVGCARITGSSPEDVHLVPDRRTYEAGDTVLARLVNRAEKAIGHGAACSLRLERFDSTGWIGASDESRGCTRELYVLDPGEQRVQRLPLIKSLPSGTYRVRQDIMPEACLPHRSIYSAAFVVHGS